MGLFTRSGHYRPSRGNVVLLVALVVASGLSATTTAVAEDGGTSDRPILGIWEPQSLTGANNNRAHPDWGQAGTVYPRLAPARYADGRGQPVPAPNARYISNRVMNDVDVHVYSERGVSQWAFVWGQFLDHTFAMRLGRRQTGEPGEPANFPFDSTDPLEQSRNDLGIIFMDRSIPAPGTGETGPREHINQISSYLDAATVYGNTDSRLDWMREGSVDGNPDNNAARMLMVDNYLPRRGTRGDPDSAPPMVIGSLFNTPELAAVAGDQRANENPPLIATHTLFAREHNRIVSLLPRWMSEQDKFQIARAVVIAEQQYITYNELLPALGVSLPRYTGYKRNTRADITNEFATVGYRAHSQIRTDFVIETQTNRYSQADLDAMRALGVEVTVTGNTVKLLVPIGEETFFNPDLLEKLQLGPVLQGVGMRPQNKNDELINNLMRSLTFDFSGNPGCAEDPSGPDCLVGVNDLAAVDVERGRDHGMPTYNQLRAAYGLPAKTSFNAITGEPSEAFPADPLLTPGNEINDPNILDFTELYDIHGNPTTPEAGNATSGVRRAPLAARLKATYGDVNSVDAFAGMISEPHLPGREFGELQLAIWRKQFTDLRDGDRFFYANDPLLAFVRYILGIDYRKGLGDLIALNSDIPRNRLARNVFLTPGAQSAAAAHTPEALRERLLPGGTLARGVKTDLRVPTRNEQPEAVLPTAPAPGAPVGRRPSRRRGATPTPMDT